MATFTKVILSGSTDGQAIDITASQQADTLTTIHVNSTSTAIIDEVYLWAHNTNSSCNVKLTVFIGDSATKTMVEQNILPEQGLIEILPGLSLQGHSAAGRTINAFRDNSGCLIFGYVNRIDQS